MSQLSSVKFIITVNLIGRGVFTTIHIIRRSDVSRSLLVSVTVNVLTERDVNTALHVYRHVPSGFIYIFLVSAFGYNSWVYIVRSMTILFCGL